MDSSMYPLHAALLQEAECNIELALSSCTPGLADACRLNVEDKPGIFGPVTAIQGSKLSKYN